MNPCPWKTKTRGNLKALAMAVKQTGAGRLTRLRERLVEG